QVEGPNYVSEMAFFSLLDGTRLVAEMTPEKRFYPVQRMPTTEAGIDRGVTRDLYVTIGDRQPGGGWAVRTYVKPYANWLWIGSIIMTLGGLMSLTDLRYRVGAPARRRVAPVPAE
ncbi:MAG: cytochrome c-type biogenesis CcmF C-terminal domain-containing protein, partial [Pseudomonadota bacterium]